MDWREEYRSKLIGAEEAADKVKSGDCVVIPGLGAEPTTIARALARRKEELEGVRVCVAAPLRHYDWYDPGMESSFELELGLGTPISRPLLAERRCDLTLQFLNFYADPTLTGENIDVFMVPLSPPDEHGFCSFGESLMNKKQQAQGAKLVLAEVFDGFIRTCGDNFIHVSEVDFFVQHVSSGRPKGSTRVAGLGGEGADEIARNIAGHLSSLIRDGDTIEIGFGATTSSLVQAGLFEGKHDLGWHSEATPAGIVKLVEEGVVTGKHKTLHAGKVVAAAVGGSSKEELEFIHNNPLIELYSMAYVDDIRIIAAHDNMVAVNNALAVDLQGQVTAESIGTRFHSITGGQTPFAIGAVLSRGGRSITVLPSTAKGGTMSRVVPVLEAGTVVTVTRPLVDYVVTEYGIASLRGKSQRQRADELISIAHPDFRSELRRQASKLFWP